MAATTYATLFRDVGDLPVVVLRLAMVYGPGDPHGRRLMPYVIDGLPPTPIANPGQAAIEAAVSPAATGYLFFVADGAGGHAFAATLEEHNANVARWREIEAELAAQAEALAAEDGAEGAAEGAPEDAPGDAPEATPSE